MSKKKDNRKGGEGVPMVDMPRPEESGPQPVDVDLPKTPAQRVEEVQRAVNDGEMSTEEAIKALDMPSLSPQAKRELRMMGEDLRYIDIDRIKPLMGHVVLTHKTDDDRATVVKVGCGRYAHDSGTRPVPLKVGERVWLVRESRRIGSVDKDTAVYAVDADLIPCVYMPPKD